MTDHRVERTCGYLREAMMALLKEKPFERITVAELVARAKVSKNSFYNHYNGLADLVQDCYLCNQVYFGPLNKRRGDYASRAEAVTELLETTAQKLVYFRENPNLARVILFNQGISPYFFKSEEIEEALHIDHVVTEYGESNCDFISFEECAAYIQAGANAIIRSWFQKGMPNDIERLSKTIAYYGLQVAAGVVGHAIEPEYKAAIDAWHFAR